MLLRKRLENDTGPGTHVTRFRGRLTPAQAEAGGRKEGRKERGKEEETKEKTEPQPEGEEKTKSIGILKT